MKNSESDTISTHSFMESKERLVKICGMKYPENIQAVAALHPDFMGFIFYPKSKRFVEDESVFEVFPNAEKVGVFVNESIENILEKVEQYKLDVVQLHGDETSRFCEELINRKHQRLLTDESFLDFKIWKAVGIKSIEDFQQLNHYKHLFLQNVEVDYNVLHQKVKDQIKVLIFEMFLFEYIPLFQ